MKLLQLLRLWPPFSRLGGRIPPSIPGAELAARKIRLHFRANNNQMHFAARVNRLHFRATER